MNLFLSTLIFLLISAAIFIAWFFLAKTFTSKSSEKLLVSIIFCLSQIIVTEIILGLLGKLYLPYLIAFNLAISAIVFIIAFRYKAIKNDFKFSGLFIYFKNPFFAAIFAIFFLMAIRTLIYGYLLHPYDYDGLEYHLPVIVEYMQHGKIADMQSNLFTRSFYPYTIELTYLWNLIFLKSDIFINLSQFFYALIGALAIYCLAGYLKVSRSYSAVAAMLWFFIPIVIIQSTTLYIDLATSSIFLATIFFLLRYFDDNDRIYLFALSCSAGIYLGTKFSALFVLAILALIFIAVAIMKKISFKRILIDLSILLAGLILISGYWYIKNAAKYHNPIYPHTITVMGKSYLNGFVPLSAIMDSQVPTELLDKNIAEQWYLSWEKSPDGYVFDSRIGGFGPIWFILCLPAILLFLYWIAKNRDKKALIVSTIFIAIFIIHPANWWSRYVMFFSAYGLIALMYLFEKFPRLIKISTAVIILFLTLYVFATTMMDTYQATSPNNLKLLFNRQVYLPDQSTDPLTGYLHQIKNTTIAYGPGRFLYSAYGKDFSNHLINISVDNCQQFDQEIIQKDVDYIIINNERIGLYGGWPGQYIKYLDTENYCVTTSGKYKQVYKANNDSLYSLWEPIE